MVRVPLEQNGHKDPHLAKPKILPPVINSLPQGGFTIRPALFKRGRVFTFKDGGQQAV